MRWVTYLSPSGGEQRTGVIDDGCVFGHPGDDGMQALLARGLEGLQEEHRRTLAEPLEIIVEFEARLCAPVRPEGPVRLRVDGAEVRVDPSLVRGTDDGIPLPEGAVELSAAVGVAVIHGGEAGPLGYTLACLWLAADQAVAALTLGPAVVTREELEGAIAHVTASVRDEPLAEARPSGAALAGDGPRGTVTAVLGQPTRPLNPGEELFVDGGGELGLLFELRVGAKA